MHFHVCGDAGVDLVLDSMEEAILVHGKDKARAKVAELAAGSIVLATGARPRPPSAREVRLSIVQRVPHARELAA